MKSISARLALWYAAAATATLACLFVAGYYLLEGYLIHGLDLLNQSEFTQIKARLGPDYQSLSADVIEQRIRETTNFASVLFYIDIHRPHSGTIFYSSNLQGRSIPDVVGKNKYSIDWDPIGQLRVAEFVMPPFDVIIATSANQVDGMMEGYAEVCAALVALMLIMSLVIGFGLSRMALRPVRLIRATASRIGSDNLSERIAVPEVSDEISDLALLLNAMFDRLEASFKHVSRFAADASHELKTPLSLVRLHAEKLLSADTLSEEHTEELHTVLEELGRLNETIDELLFLSRAESHGIKLDLAPHDPAALLANFNVDAQVLAEHHDLQFSYTHEGAGIAVFEPRWLRRVLLNLLTNSVNASPPGGRIRLHSRLQEDLWHVEFEDQGVGVPAEDRERIFDRFVRIEQDASREYKGTGLGLAICRGIIELHRGKIAAAAGSEGRGLRIIFEIPARSDVAAPAVNALAPASAASA